MGVKACIRAVARAERRNHIINGDKKHAFSGIPTLLYPPDRSYAIEFMRKFRAGKVTVLRGDK